MDRNNAIESPMWVDTHCHLDVEPLCLKQIEVLDRARNAGIGHFIVPGIRGPAKNFISPNVLFAWGVHPGNASFFENIDLKDLFAQRNYDPVAIGEIGLDIQSPADFNLQLKIFSTQLEIAKAENLPVLIHLRGFWNQALAALKNTASDLPWVMHAFSGNFEIAKLFLRGNAFISFGGSLCFSNAKKTPRVALETPIEKILLETDAPDMAPPGWKKDENEPAALLDVAKKLCQIKKIELSELKSQVWKNIQKARLMDDFALHD
ncbi:MAG: TatD family hydrolase [Candidatus Riflebacteria bacterium]|nr:TatD family hydrolase [Candidatus Riflebacteria bacterium]